MIIIQDLAAHLIFHIKGIYRAASMLGMKKHLKTVQKKCIDRTLNKDFMTKWEKRRRVVPTYDYIWLKKIFIFEAYYTFAHRNEKMAIICPVLDLI